MNLTKRTGGFTLIELLVVISILGLMASITFASLNTVRDRGKIAAGQKFESANKHAYNADALASWNFDEPSGTVALDAGANQLQGTLVAMTANPIPSRVEGMKGTALQFNGNNYVTAAAAFTSTMLTSQSYMASAWIYPTEATTGTYYLIFGAMPGMRYLAIRNGVLVALMNNGINNIWEGSNSSIPLNKWTHIALRIDANGGYVTYINGTEDRRVTAGGMSVAYYPIPFTVGHEPSLAGVSVKGFVGNIDEPALYAIDK